MPEREDFVSKQHIEIHIVHRVSHGPLTRFYEVCTDLEKCWLFMMHSLLEQATLPSEPSTRTSSSELRNVYVRLCVVV